MTSPRFLVMTGSARIRGNKFGTYSNVAVVETDEQGYPAFIGERARHCVRVVRHWGPQSVGKTPKCAFARALVDAEDMVTALELEHGCVWPHRGERRTS